MTFIRAPLPRIARFALLTAVIGGFGAALAGMREQGPQADRQAVSILFAGDICVDGHPGEMIAAGKDPFAEFAEVLSAADLRIGNLECVVATKGKPVDKPWVFRAHPRVLALLGRYFHSFSLANNHTGDYGHEAFLEQLDHLKRQKIGYFGGGANTLEARTPWITECNGLRIALLGYNDYSPRSFEAGPTWPGVAWCVDEQMLADIAAARTIHKADLVIPFLHWGWEEYPADRRQKKLARALIDQGADMVVGAHPHVTQGAEVYKGKPIVYSLGNFVFEGFKTRATQTGWLLRVQATKQGITRWETLAAVMNEQGIPRRANLATPCGTDDGGMEKRVVLR